MFLEKECIACPHLHFYTAVCLLSGLHVVGSVRRTLADTCLLHGNSQGHKVRRPWKLCVPFSCSPRWLLQWIATLCCPGQRQSGGRKCESQTICQATGCVQLCSSIGELDRVLWVCRDELECASWVSRGELNCVSWVIRGELECVSWFRRGELHCITLPAASIYWLPGEAW
jgi:hypothetical protein